MVGVANTVYDIAASTVDLAVNVGGAFDYELSGGEYGQAQYEALGETFGGLAQLAQHPVDTASAGFSGWYGNTIEAYNDGRDFDYGVHINNGVRDTF